MKTSLLVTAAFVMLTVGREGRAVELPPADFLSGQPNCHRPAPDFLVGSDLPPRPAGNGWQWDPNRKLWWRWVPVVPAPQRPALSPTVRVMPRGVTWCGPAG